MKTSIQVRSKDKTKLASRQAPISRRQPAEFKIMRLRECPVESAAMETPVAVERFWRDHIATAPWFKADKECLVVLLLNARRRLLGFESLSQGTKDTLLVNTAEVFRLATARNASAIIIAHNHPSGDPTPSEGDIKTTRDLINAGLLLKVELLDHVIIGAVRHVPSHCSLRGFGCFSDFYVPAAQQASTGAQNHQPVGLTKQQELENAIDQAAALNELLEHRVLHPGDGGGYCDSIQCGIVELGAQTFCRLRQAADSMRATVGELKKAA